MPRTRKPEHTVGVMSPLIAHGMPQDVQKIPVAMFRAMYKRWTGSSLSDEEFYIARYEKTAIDCGEHGKYYPHNRLLIPVRMEKKYEILNGQA